MTELNYIAKFIAVLLVLSLAIGAAFGGTEDGSFCPDCPDWTNLDGWMAQKEAYELQNSPLAQSHPIATSSSESSEKASLVTKAQKGYSVPEIFATIRSLEGMVLLDARSPEEYSKGHLPGARNLYWKGIQTSGSLDPVLAEEALCKIGVNNSDRVLVYGGPDSGASYLFWALSYLGQKNLSKLNGGIDAAAGAALDTSLLQVKRSNYTAKIVPWLMVDETMLGSWLSRDDVQILDARDFTDYGRSRLTGAALNIPVDKLYEDDFLVADPDALEGVFSGRSLNKDSTQLVYGTPQAYSLFYSLKLMGYNATLIDGDWWSKTEWAVDSVQ
jgi:thiosulfate/3-mercaptopyruvate sulfurtransferase